MSHFYGRIQGSRGEATRCGSAASGIHTTARTWDGDLLVSLGRNGAQTADLAGIWLKPEYGHRILLGEVNYSTVMRALSSGDPAVMCAIEQVRKSFKALDTAAQAVYNLD